MNYDNVMQEQIAALTAKKNLLLHTCCAPCSSSVLEKLADIFNITVFFYNPNISEEVEYNKRLEELKEFIYKLKKDSVKLLVGTYNPASFFQIATGLEQENECGKRCYQCYKLRLEETAKVARQNHFDYFTTTLSTSPYKNSNWLNAIGGLLEQEYSQAYLYADFKKRDGYKRSIELSKQYNLYRQNYCGCIYSKYEKEGKQN